MVSPILPVQACSASPAHSLKLKGTPLSSRTKRSSRSTGVSDLERRPQGVDTPGLMLIKVRALQIRYRDGDADKKNPDPVATCIRVKGDLFEAARPQSAD